VTSVHLGAARTNPKVGEGVCEHDSMDDSPTDAPGSAVGESEQTYCYNHRETPTRLRCSRCDRPICGRCAIPASVGQHCPECVAEARRTAPKVKSAVVATAPVVVTILVVNVVVWFGQRLEPDLTRRFATVPVCVADGQWWRLITAMFLHAPNAIWHIAFNSIALYLFGPNVEQAFGSVRFAVMYLISGFVGSAFSYALGPGTSGVGASGAIFGILGVLLVYAYNRRTSAVMGSYLRNILMLLALNLFLGFVYSEFIDNYAHIGGLLGGIGLGLGFDQGHRATPNVARQALTAAVVLGVGAGLVVYKTATVTFPAISPIFC
jgi:membrane associated rhomboid family serine protease